MVVKPKRTAYKCKDAFPAEIQAWGNITMNLLTSYSLSLAAYASWIQRVSVKLLLFAVPLTSAGAGGSPEKAFASANSWIHDTQSSSGWEKKSGHCSLHLLLFRNFVVTYI